QTGKARSLAQVERGNACTAEQHRGRGRNNGLHEDCKCEQQRTSERPGEFPVFSRVADDRQHSCNKQDVGSRISETTRRKLRVLHEARAKQDSGRDRDKNECQRQRPVAGQKAAEQSVNKEREQQDQGEIAEVALAKEDVLDCTEISETRSAVVEDAFAAFEEACQIAL